MKKFSELPYERIEFDEIKRNYNQFMSEFKEANSGEQQFQIHKKKYEFLDYMHTKMTLARIRFNIDMENEFYAAEKAYYDEIQPKIDQLEIEYSNLLYESKYRDYLEHQIGVVAFKNMELKRNSFNESLIPLIQEENALITRYQKLIATAKIEWDDKIINLSYATKYLSDGNRDIRKKVSQLRSKWFQQHENELDTIYDRLVKNRDKQAKLLGYENYIELGYQRMSRNCYDKDMIKHYRDQVKKFLVPFSEKLHDQRRQRLHLEKLYGYDDNVSFLEGNPITGMSEQEILEIGQKMYGRLSSETKEFFDFMMERDLFDVNPRKAKRSGGYMTYLPEYRAPFVFANFNGSSYDVKVITHECGHAFQGYLAGKDPIREHADVTMETAEIHSMSMEFFTEPYMELFFGERSEDYIRMHFENAVNFIPYGCTVDEFQHIVYENPEMTPDERKAVWRKLELEYKPHLDFGEDEYMSKGGFWQKQQHIYVRPFYYIDYCLAQTCALQYKVWMDEDYQGAWESYLSLCKLSASDFYTHLLELVKLESPFGTNTIEKLVHKLENKMGLSTERN